MARRTVEVVECDICGSPDGIASYSISSPVGTSEVELCGKHQALLDDVFKAGRVRKRPGRRPTSTGAAARKAAAQKAATKKAAPKRPGQKRPAQKKPGQKKPAAKKAAKRGAGTTLTRS